MTTINDLGGLLEASRKILEDSQSVEAVIQYLREQTGKKTESILVLSRLLGIQIGEAKTLVHYSEAWKDSAKRDEKFHQQVEAILAKNQRRGW
jgi:ribosomal protein L7/L12